MSKVSASEDPILFLAIDHRNSVERDLYKLGSPGPDTEAAEATEARITADKLLVYQALLDAVPQLPKGVRPGILIDEEYGASVAELAGRAKDVVSLAMPIEASGKDWLEFAYGDDWVRHAEFFPTDYSKVLGARQPRLRSGAASAAGEPFGRDLEMGDEHRSITAHRADRAGDAVGEQGGRVGTGV